MGWLGWTYEETMRTDINGIEIALEGRAELLKMIFGSSKKEKPAGSIVERFKAFVARHNRAMRK